MAKPGRPLGHKHDELTRSRIQATSIINRLTLHALADKPIMDASQVNAARALLNKVLPDLKAVEVTGQDGGPLTVQIVRFSEPK